MHKHATIPVSKTQNRVDYSAATSTDNVVGAAFNEGYDGVRLYDIMDGGYSINGTFVDVPINETIINEGRPRLILDLEENK